MKKEFIIKNQNKTLKELFPEHFRKFTGWAKTNSEDSQKWLMYFKNNIIQYGFSGSGEWHINEKKEYQFNYDIDYEASNFEVEERLIEEARKRGYSKYNYKCLVIPKCTHITDGTFYLNQDLNNLHIGLNGGSNVIMKDGIWAEIINVMSKKEAEEKFNIVIR